MPLNVDGVCVGTKKMGFPPLAGVLWGRGPPSSLKIVFFEGFQVKTDVFGVFCTKNNEKQRKTAFFTDFATLGGGSLNRRSPTADSPCPLPRRRTAPGARPGKCLLFFCPGPPWPRSGGGTGPATERPRPSIGSAPFSRTAASARPASSSTRR